MCKNMVQSHEGRTALKMDELRFDGQILGYRDEITFYEREEVSKG